MSRSSHFNIHICAYVAFIAVTLATNQEKCGQIKCPGPLAYYEAIGCSPIYEKEDDCCATKYNCGDRLVRSPTKCYANGKSYEIGEKLKDEDKYPCIYECTCMAGDPQGAINRAQFVCAVIDCYAFLPKPGCYIRRSLSRCCTIEEVCPENPEDRAICNVNGREYKEGEYFWDERSIKCVCLPGYEGKNVEPFCTKPKRPFCHTDLRVNIFVNNCAPVYLSTQSPQTDCSVAERCQNNDDTVIHIDNNSKSTDDEDVCHFGNLTMHRGDELNRVSGPYFCDKCVCEVPPLPTCRRLSDDECNVV